MALIAVKSEEFDTLCHLVLDKFILCVWSNKGF